MNLSWRVAIACAASLALSACLTSDGLLFDSQNARARPFAAGVYDACQYEGRSETPDCKRVAVEPDASGEYRFRPKDEDEVTYARFRRAVRGAYAAQLWTEGDDDPFYFLTLVKGDEIVMSMIDCEGLPKAYRDKYVARGELEVDDDATVCTAKTPGAVVAAARAWLASDARRTGARIVYTRASDRP
jgi:hypothetical protein